MSMIAPVPVTTDPRDGVAEASGLDLRGRLALLAAGADTSAGVEDVLRLGRRYLALDVAFVGRVEDGRRRLRAVSAADASLEAMAGHVDPLEGSHCALVLAGDVEPVMADALTVPSMVEVRATHDFGVRGFVGVPITLPDGEVYGTLCGFCHAVRPDLDRASTSVLRFLAALVAVQVDTEHAGGRARREVRSRLELMIESGQPRMVFQPIVHLMRGRTTGYEALARFDSDPPLPPNHWFDAADEVELGARLEALAIGNALRRLPELSPGTRMSVNTSALHLASAEVQDALGRCDLSRVVVELTEYERDIDTESVLASLERLRRGGAKIALDDVGSGYAGLERVVRLGPDRIKLDRSLVAGIDRHLAQRAMVAATVSYARQVGAEIVAEGIETVEELVALRELDVELGQGYLLARPAEALVPPDATHWLEGARRAA